MEPDCIHYRIYKSPSLDQIQRQLNPLNALTTFFPEACSSAFYYLFFGLSNSLFTAVINERTKMLLSILLIYIWGGFLKLLAIIGRVFSACLLESNLFYCLVYSVCLYLHVKVKLSGPYKWQRYSIYFYWCIPVKFSCMSVKKQLFVQNSFFWLTESRYGDVGNISRIIYI